MFITGCKLYAMQGTDRTILLTVNRFHHISCRFYVFATARRPSRDSDRAFRAHPLAAAPFSVLALISPGHQA